MILFLIGIIILFVGGYFYGKYCVKVFKPDDRITPATSLADGVDFVEMKKWKNQLI
ncbi:MAG: carbon starvation CstA family protein, partial [Anaerococcus sp.]|nr:carbon starvation CstA family protein [Anaerococcus sp.]